MAHQATALITPKQARFVAEYLVDLNGKQAAIRAGYSPQTAQAQASRLLTNAKVKELVRAATKALMDSGAFFSRPYGEQAGAIMNRDAASVEMLKKLKRVFDPNNVMNPGKLCF